MPPAHPPPGEEDEYFPDFIRSKTEEYSKRIRKLQEDYLYPLKEDLADWINRVLETDDLTAENFMQKLDNGVRILRLAKIIESQCSLFSKIVDDNYGVKIITSSPAVKVSVA